MVWFPFSHKICSLDDAVEGEDKFTGYTALAKWSDKKGVYKKYVVDRNDPFLVNLGIKEMPYSLFRESKDPYQLPETSRNEREKRPNGPSEQLGAEGESIDDRKPKAFGASSKKRSRFNDDEIKSSNDLTQEVIDLCDDEIKQEPPDDSPFESGR